MELWLKSHITVYVDVNYYESANAKYYFLDISRFNRSMYSLEFLKWIFRMNTENEFSFSLYFFRLCLICSIQSDSFFSFQMHICTQCCIFFLEISVCFVGEILNNVFRYSFSFHSTLTVSFFSLHNSNFILHIFYFLSFLSSRLVYYYYYFYYDFLGNLQN